MAYNKFMKIQHCVNPAMLPTHHVYFSHENNECFLSGQVLFFTAEGGHWSADDRHHHFVGVYDQDHGALIALLNVRTIIKIVPPAPWN